MDCKQGTRLITGQISTLLDQLNNESFNKAIPLFHGATIGQHMRHILEFYVCLFEGANEATIDYNGRKRNLLLSENIGAAQAVLDYIDIKVDHLHEHQGLKILNEFCTDKKDDRGKYFSSMGRELQYAFDHAVHHLAIIRMGIETEFPHIDIDPELGIAPSTLNFHNMQGLDIQSISNNL